MADGDIKLSDSPNVDKGYVEKDSKMHRTLLLAEPEGTLIMSDSANVDTGYVVDGDGKKHRVHLVAEPEGTLEMSDNASTDTGYIIDGDGKKHKVQLVASLTGSSPTPPVTPYPVLSRVKDDTDTEIGTVCCHIVDANNQEYAVVCLDNTYRTTGSSIISNNVSITGLPEYASCAVYSSKETATFCCNTIEQFAVDNNYTAPAITFCHGKTFTIDGTTYKAQVPTYVELISIFMNIDAINDLDAGSNPNLKIQTTQSYESCTQNSAQRCYVAGNNGTNLGYKGNAYYILNVLEIPINS